MVEVFIPKLVKSLNKFKGRHWSYYDRIKKGWFSALAVMLGAGEHHNAFQHVTITAYCDSTRNFLDDDNFRGGCKPVVDCLKNLGWIKDDSLKWVQVEYTQKIKGDDGTTETGTCIQVRPQNKAVGSLCASCAKRLLGGLGPFIVERGPAPSKADCYLCGDAAICAVVLHVWRA